MRVKLSSGVEMSLGNKWVWPDGKKAAVSLTFDDARTSQVDQGIPLLDRYGIKATFYLSPQNIALRNDAWRTAAAHGHEMGNHTLTHPCSGNFLWSRENALEDKTLDDISVELRQATDSISSLLGVHPISFAYPCGQKYIGRGAELKSYVPLVAKQFLSGRGFRDETINAPLFCDLAQTMGVDSDDQLFLKLKSWIERAVVEEGWLVFCSHDVGVFPRQAMPVDVLESVCSYCSDASKGIWIDTVGEIASYIQRIRS